MRLGAHCSYLVTGRLEVEVSVRGQSLLGRLQLEEASPAAAVVAAADERLVHDLVLGKVEVVPVALLNASREGAPIVVLDLLPEHWAQLLGLMLVGTYVRVRAYEPRLCLLQSEVDVKKLHRHDACVHHRKPCRGSTLFS